MPADTLTDVQWAARFLMLQRLVYGGKPGSASFPARRQRPENLGAANLRRAVEPVNYRVGGAVKPVVELVVSNK